MERGGIVGVELGGDHLQGFATEGAACDEDAGREKDGAREEEGELAAEAGVLGEGGGGGWRWGWASG